MEKRNIQEQRTNNGQLQAVKSENLERENLYLNYSLSVKSDGDTDTGYIWLNKENNRVKYTIVGENEKSSIYEIKNRMISCGDIHIFDGGCEVVSNQRSLLFQNLASINTSDYKPLFDTVEIQEKGHKQVDGQKAYCYEISASNGTELNLTRNVCLGGGNGLPIKMKTEVETSAHLTEG